MISKAAIGDLHTLKVTYREFFALTELRHKNVILMHELLNLPGHIGLVMEYATGGNLETYIRSKHYVDEVSAWRIFAQIVAGVEYCHNKRIVHRDLKPENVMLHRGVGSVGEGAVQVKIVDFGMAIAMESGDFERCGTPHYMSPEQFDGRIKPSLEDLVDIWALGVILYQMLSGFLPFTVKTETQWGGPSAIKENVVRPGRLALDGRAYVFDLGRYDEIPSISSQASDLIKKCLKTQTSERIRMADIKIHQWMLMEDIGLLEKLEARAIPSPAPMKILRPLLVPKAASKVQLQASWNTPKSAFKVLYFNLQIREEGSKQWFNLKEHKLSMISSDADVRRSSQLFIWSDTPELIDVPVQSVRWRPKKRGKGSRSAETRLNSDACSITIAGLKTRRVFEFRVRATSTIGPGPWSEVGVCHSHDPLPSGGRSSLSGVSSGRGVVRANSGPGSFRHRPPRQLDVKRRGSRVPGSCPSSPIVGKFSGYRGSVSRQSPGGPLSRSLRAGKIAGLTYGPVGLKRGKSAGHNARRNSIRARGAAGSRQARSDRADQNSKRSTPSNP